MTVEVREGRGKVKKMFATIADWNLLQPKRA